MRRFIIDPEMTNAEILDAVLSVAADAAEERQIDIEPEPQE